jgi:hypothetical protein
MNRRWLGVGALALLVVAGLVVWAVRPGGGSPPPAAPAASPCVIGTSLPTQPTGATSAGGGGVRVVEQGFSQLDGDGLVVSIGAVIENTGTEVAYQTPIRFRVFDGGHDSAVPASSGELLTQVIPVIMPGERVGAGAWSYLASDPGGAVIRAASVDIELGEPQWWPVDGPLFRFAPVTAVHRKTRYGDYTTPFGNIDYVTTSAYCGSVADRGVATVFRDRAGAIIGGNLTWPYQRGCRGGKADASAPVITGIPAHIDDTRTTHSPYCDPVPRRPDPSAPNQPAN